MAQGYSEIVLPIIRASRELSLSNYGIAAVHSIKSGNASDVVTQIDIDIESFAKARLAEAYPDVEFVGEESGGNREAERFWLMDPIDGTAHFVRGLPFCTTMLALIEHGEVTFSVIYDFVNDIIYSAEKGKGAFKNGERISVSNRGLAEAYYSIETNLKKPENLERFKRLIGRGLRVQLICAGWEFAMVACGKLDARIAIDPHGKDYDFAPGCLLVAEAGGIVRNFGSDGYDYRNLNFIAANPITFRDLTEGQDAPLSE